MTTYTRYILTDSSSNSSRRRRHHQDDWLGTSTFPTGSVYTSRRHYDSDSDDSDHERVLIPRGSNHGGRSSGSRHRRHSPPEYVPSTARSNIAVVSGGNNFSTGRSHRSHATEQPYVVLAPVTGYSSSSSTLRNRSISAQEAGTRLTSSILNNNRYRSMPATTSATMPIRAVHWDEEVRVHTPSSHGSGSGRSTPRRRNAIFVDEPSPKVIERIPGDNLTWTNPPRRAHGGWVFDQSVTYSRRR